MQAQVAAHWLNVAVKVLALKLKIGGNLYISTQFQATQQYPSLMYSPDLARLRKRNFMKSASHLTPPMAS